MWRQIEPIVQSTSTPESESPTSGAGPSLLDEVTTAPPYAAQVVHRHRYGVIAGAPYTQGSVPDRATRQLHTEERAAAAAAGPARSAGWAAGRLALRTALLALGSTPIRDPILPTERGAPAMPEGFVGSISHKDGIALALATSDHGQRLGIDIEAMAPRRERIASRVLRPEELASIEQLPRDQWWQQVVIRFSLKEAAYKAIDACLCDELGFTDFSTRLQISAPASGLPGFEAARVTLERYAAAPDPKIIHASYAVSGEYVISVAEARRTDFVRVL